MAIAVLVATISAPFAQGAQGLYNALSAWLAANPSIHILDVDTFRYESEHRADEQRIRILYETGLAISGGWQARFYITDDTGSAQTLFTTDMNTATFVPWFMIDVTHHKTGRSSGDAFISIGVNTVTDPYGFNGKNVYIANPSAAIAAGASGTASIYDGSGTLLGTRTVYNVSATIWAKDERNYAVIDQTTGNLIGLAACATLPTALVSPTLTTTTSFPCPAYLAQALPNTVTVTPS